jgi:uncharacterized glyoxalase superfamily protein PhnB
MAEIRRVSPILPVRDVAAAVSFYASLGFTTRAYNGGHDYGFVTWGDVEIHLGSVGADAQHSSASIYLFVDDADELARTWRGAGADVRPPQNTEWGKREGVVVDPDGNVIRFGSPV